MKTNPTLLALLFASLATANLLAQPALVTDPGFQVKLDGEVRILARSGNKVVLVGSFSSVNGHLSPGVARLNADGTVDTNFVAAPATPLPLMWYHSAKGDCVSHGDFAALPDGKLLALGVEGKLVRLKSDGKLDTSFQAPELVGWRGCWGGNVRPILGPQSDGKIIVQRLSRETVGENEVVHIRLARLNENGAIDASFAPIFRQPAIGRPDDGYSEAASLFQALTVQTDDKIVVAGVFTEVNGVARYGLARLNADGSHGCDKVIGENS